MAERVERPADHADVPHESLRATARSLATGGQRQPEPEQSERAKAGDQRRGEDKGDGDAFDRVEQGEHDSGDQGGDARRHQHSVRGKGQLGHQERESRYQQKHDQCSHVTSLALREDKVSG